MLIDYLKFALRKAAEIPVFEEEKSNPVSCLSIIIIAKKKKCSVYPAFGVVVVVVVVVPIVVIVLH